MSKQYQALIFLWGTAAGLVCFQDVPGRRMDGFK